MSAGKNARASGGTSMTTSVDDTLCVLATEWWKVTNRLIRLCDKVAISHRQREQAMAEYAFKRIGAALLLHGISIVDQTGKEFGPSLPAEPINPDDFDNGDDLVVIDTIEPTLVRNGQILARGKVALGHRPNAQRSDI